MNVEWRRVGNRKGAQHTHEHVDGDPRLLSVASRSNSSKDMDELRLGVGERERDGD